MNKPLATKKTADDVLVEAIAKLRGIPKDKVRDTFDYLTLKDQLDIDWNAPVNESRNATTEIEARVFAFIAQWGKQMGRL